jgi:membrane protein implicated in regulation of membrane protease activity
MMEELAKAIGAALSAMSPVLQAVVILGASVAGLVYVWRRSGEEAKRDREKAESARVGTDSAVLKAIKDDVAAIKDDFGAMKTDLKILLDRVDR